MKRVQLVLLGLLMWGFDLSARAQIVEALTASVIAGGGLSGGTDQLSATIGQWDAMPSNPEAIAPISGFWNAEPPLSLRLQRIGGSVVIAWPASSTAFQLEQAARADSGAIWASLTQPIILANGEHQVTVPIGPAAQFFRLRQL